MLSDLDIFAFEGGSLETLPRRRHTRAYSRAYTLTAKDSAATPPPLASSEAPLNNLFGDPSHPGPL